MTDKVILFYDGDDELGFKDRYDDFYPVHAEITMELMKAIRKVKDQFKVDSFKAEITFNLTNMAEKEKRKTIEWQMKHLKTQMKAKDDEK